MFTFTDGAVPTAAQINQAISPASQAGKVRVDPIANVPTSVHVSFDKPFPVPPVVVAVPQSTEPGNTVRAVWVDEQSVTREGFDVWVWRTSDTNTLVSWQAWLPLSLAVAGGWLPADVLNQAGLDARAGTVTITPTTANDPKSATVSFGATFLAAPTVVTCAVTDRPDQVKGTSATGPTTTGATIWVTRSNLTATDVTWVALGRLA